MSEFYSQQNDSITHPSIVHELLKKIVTELGIKEFRGGYKKPIINGGLTYMDYVPDSRSEYIQGVESLSDILLPQYDDTMTAAAKVYYKAVEEIEKGLEKKDVRMGDDNHNMLVRKKLKLVRTLFRELNLLLKRTNYLKAAAYTEDDLEDDEEEEI
jgi:hypothetical protein